MKPRIFTGFYFPIETFIHLKLMSKAMEISATEFIYTLVDKEWERKLTDSSLGNQINENVRQMVRETLLKMVKQKKQRDKYRNESV